mmetsp:Transcript_2496/g.3331  ORF Transcript_2496/g.3331 Transcript_2496/m.3331 type:complete len:1145 (-) Transcript_2496:48-3482(-)
MDTTNNPRTKFMPIHQDCTTCKTMRRQRRNISSSSPQPSNFTSWSHHRHSLSEKAMTRWKAAAVAMLISMQSVATVTATTTAAATAKPQSDMFTSSTVQLTFVNNYRLKQKQKGTKYQYQNDPILSKFTPATASLEHSTFPFPSTVTTSSIANTTGISTSSFEKSAINLGTLQGEDKKQTKSSRMMMHSIKNAMNRKIDDYDITTIRSSKKHAISPIPPPLPLSPYHLRNNKHELATSSSSHLLTKKINHVWKNQRSNNAQISSNMLKGTNRRRARKQLTSTIRNLWKKRNARSIEEGIRRTDPNGNDNDNNEKNTNETNNNVENQKQERTKALETILQEETFFESNIKEKKYDDSNGKFDISQYSSSVNQQSSPNQKSKNSRGYVARTISGLISALAEEAIGLEVSVQSRDDTPLWHKHVDKLSIQFERLGVKQLKMGGLLDEALYEINQELQPFEKESMANSLHQAALTTASEVKQSPSSSLQSSDLHKNGRAQSVDGNDETNDFSKDGLEPVDRLDLMFDRIDTDKSGSLDEEELTRALTIASGISSLKDQSIAALSKLAERLVNLYDTNGDGVVDRDEYKKLVEDMTAVRDAQRVKQIEIEERRRRRRERLEMSNRRFNPLRWGRIARRAFFRMKQDGSDTNSKRNVVTGKEESTSSSTFSSSFLQRAKGSINKSDEVSVLNHIQDDSSTSSSVDTELKNNQVMNSSINFESAEDISNDPKVFNAMTKGEGSIVFEDLKLDLRRLLFGAVPLVKKITPGGPLILEPFSFTVTGSFNKEDILESVLLDDALRRLVARALRRRVRSIRDLLDGAVFYGRTWNMASKQAPVVEVPKLTNIEFDNRNRLIITGRARVRTSPDQPFVENSFKLRTKLGTRENGQYIRLEEPELALVLECPKSWERNIVYLCKNFKLPVPERPEPVDKFFPLVSPIKATEQDGFNLGEDNRIKSIYIKDDALRFEISAVLRPGRFLGNHYLAFTVPNRTFIITMDRIREGIRTARENKRKLREFELHYEIEEKKHVSDRYKRAVAQALSKSTDIISNGSDIDLSFKKELGNDEDLRFLDPKISKDSVEENEVLPNNRPGFIGRFLEGYLDAAREETERERNDRLTSAISEFFSSGEEVSVYTVTDSNNISKRRGVV